MTRNATDLPFHYPPELELDAPPIEHAHPTDAVRARKRMSGRIIALAAALWLCMLPLRAIVMGYIDPVSYPTPKLRDLPELLLIGVYDFGYVLAITLVALLAMRLLGRWRILRWSVLGGFLIVAVASLLACMGNIEFVRLNGRPFNLQWLYYSGFLQSADARQAVASNFYDEQGHYRAAPIYQAAKLLAMMFGLMLALRLLARVTIPRRISSRELAFAVIPLAIAYLVFGTWFLNKYKWNHSKLQNPVTAFAASVVRSHAMPPLFAMQTDVEPKDVFTVAERGESSKTAAPTTAPSAADAGVKNVVLFVMESVPARYLDVYGGGYSVTPNLDATREHAAVFDNIYAHAPATNMSLLSLLCSIYPPVSYKVPTEERPDLPIPSLTSVLKARGYRTGFFFSTDSHFQKADEFLEHRGFDLVEDYRSRNGPTFSSEQWAFLTGSDDVSTAESLEKWISQPGANTATTMSAAAGDSNRPFFAVLWTGMTHYPYFPTGEQRAYKTGDAYRERYLNALHRGDEALGSLLKHLADNNLLDSTLVVVLGDHGEQFAQHGTYGHASAIYDENVHIPLLMINSKLFHGEQRSGIGGMVDVAPTICDLMGLPPAAEWQGRSLFAADRPQRVYFFSPWSDFLFGVRDGDHKVIFNATAGSFEVYNLANDPNEKVNLAGDPKSLPLITDSQKRLAAWVQYERKCYERLNTPAH